MDMSAFYRVMDNVKLFAGVQNMFNNKYLVSRQPEGPRPGMPISAYGGFEIEL
jgi:Fe(3+) dicitrate transport protein